MFVTMSLETFKVNAGLGKPQQDCFSIELAANPHPLYDFWKVIIERDIGRNHGP
jgi:hypothetical protein